jgi:dTDP-4-dehydrorhamnose 3,5-epimerase
MLMLEVRSLAIPDVKLIRTSRFSDGRGYFCETFQRPAFAAQRPPFAQTKLIRVLGGAIFDVAVDLRRSSPSFGEHVAIELDSESGEQLLVPSGFAQAFARCSPERSSSTRSIRFMHRAMTAGSIGPIPHGRSTGL